MDYLEKVLTRFPIEQLFFIIAFGMFMVISCPVDVLSLDFSHGLPSACLLLDQLMRNFSPFMGVKYLGMEFPLGLVKVLLLSFPIGAIAFLLYDEYGWANNKVRGIFDCITKGKECKECKEFRKWIREQVNLPRRIWDWITKEKKNEEEESDEQIRRAQEVREFNDWIKERGMSRSIDLYSSMRLASVALLYGVETFLIVVMLWAITTLPTPSRHFAALSWVFFSFLLVLCCYAAFWCYRRRLVNIFHTLEKQFRAERPQNEASRNHCQVSIY